MVPFYKRTYTERKVTQSFTYLIHSETIDCINSFRYSKKIYLKTYVRLELFKEFRCYAWL